MRQFFFTRWLLFVILQLPIFAYGQSTTYTPNLNLALPPAAPGTWGEQYNNNFSTLDGVTGHPAHVLQDEGVSLPARSKLNFLGTGITATDNSGADSTDVTISITGAGHQIKDEGGTTLTQRPIMNFTGGGVTCTDNSGQNATVCDIPAGSVNVASAFAWTGVNSWVSNNWSLFDSSDNTKIAKWNISGFTTGTTRIFTLPNATTRLLGDSDFSATGIMARTAANAYAGRTLSAGVINEFNITNGDGVAGNPTIALGSLAVKTDRSATFSTGDFNLASASSFTFPSSTGATPASEGRCAQDTTSHRLKCHFGTGGVVTLAITSEVQALNANLTALSGLSGVNNAIPIFTAAGTMTSGVLPPCADSGGQHLNYDTTTHNWSCGTSSTGGLSGATTSKFLFSTSATTFDTSGNLSQAAGVVNASGGFTIGDVSTNYIGVDTSTVTGAKTWSTLNFSGTIRPSTGVITAGHVVTVDANGLLVDGGAAGAGTVTPSTVDIFTNKTLDVEATGNVITTVSKIWLPAAGGTAAAPGLLWDTLAANAPTPVCSAGATETTMLRCTADFPDSDGEYSLQQEIALPSDWNAGAIDALIKYRTVTANATLNTVWQIKTACRADAEVDDVAWNTASTVTDAGKATTLQLNDATISGITTTGCAAGELMHLMVMRQRTHASDTMTGTVSLVGVQLTLRRAQ